MSFYLLTAIISTVTATACFVWFFIKARRDNIPCAQPTLLFSLAVAFVAIVTLWVLAFRMEHCPNCDAVVTTPLL